MDLLKGPVFVQIPFTHYLFSAEIWPVVAGDGNLLIDLLRGALVSKHKFSPLKKAIFSDFLNK